MSSKLNVKAKGKDSRPKSSDRLRRKRDGTPEKSATPSQEQDEGLTPTKNIIWNEEIEKLQIKADDFPKVWPPRPPSAERKTEVKSVPVQKMKKQSELDKPKSRMVSVAKPAPPDAPVKPMDYTGYAGPRYDENGEIIPHSLLGCYEDFHREATKQGKLPDGMPSPKLELSARAETPSLKYEKKRHHMTKQSKDENNALRNWQHRMMERKRQQGYISKLLQKAPEDLTMNQADTFRKVQEQRYLIDRTIPRVDYGKGYRVGSEFWYQQEQFGDDLTGLHMTLTQAQRGYPAPIQHIGLPQVTKSEKGCEWLGQDRQSGHVNYPWQRSQYLETRKHQLQPYMNELDPWTPDFENLQVIGSNKPYVGQEDEDEKNKRDDEEFDAYLDSYGGGGEEDATVSYMDYHKMDGEEPVTDGYQDESVVQNEPVFGPSLLFAGQPARWTGDSFSFKDEIGIEARVTFEALTGDRITSHLELVNDGTTSIYYDWKKMAKENPFDLVTKVVQRFYFNNSSGVILPGETLKFPFVFKSPNAGVFTEQWQLETRPVLCGGAALFVTLRGVALQEDKFKKQREDLEKELVQKQAQQVVTQLLNSILSGIRTPERSRSPVDAYITEEEIFCRNNPGLNYKPDLVARLKEIHAQLFEEDRRAENIWSLSLQDLQDNILELEEDEDKQENLLHQMNALIGQLTYIPEKPKTEQLQSAGCQLFREAIDRMAGEAMFLRSTIGLPDREQDDLEGDASDSRKGARATESRTKPDVLKEKGKAAAKDPKAPKGAPGKTDPKGKTTPASAAKKTPTPVKTAAPTPAPVPTPGEKEPTGEGLVSQPVTPDPNTSQTMSDIELAAAEKCYLENFNAQVYNILGEMIDKMDMIFSAIKEEK